MEYWETGNLVMESGKIFIGKVSMVSIEKADHFSYHSCVKKLQQIWVVARYYFVYEKFNTFLSVNNSATYN